MILGMDSNDSFALGFDECRYRTATRHNRLTTSPPTSSSSERASSPMGYSSKRYSTASKLVFLIATASSCASSPARAAHERASLAGGQIVQIDGIYLTRRPSSWQGQGDEVELTVTVQNRTGVPVFISSKAKAWKYDSATKTLIVDFSEQPQQPRPRPTDSRVSVGFPQHTFPLRAELTEIPPHSKVDLKEARPIVMSRYRMVDADKFQTDEVDTSGMERVTVIVPLIRRSSFPETLRTSSRIVFGSAPGERRLRRPSTRS